MARRRSRRPLLLRPLPLFTAIVGAAALIYGVWPSRDNRPPRLTGEVDTTALQPAIKPLASPATATLVGPDKPGPSSGSVGGEPRVQMPAPPTTQPTVTRPAVSDPAQASSDFQAGLAAKTRNEILPAREQLNRALHAGLPAAQMETARQALGEIANQTIFSPVFIANDPLVESHTVGSGETLGKLARQFSISEDLLAEVNKLRDKHIIRLGMRLKIPRGPFHAVITKSDHLLHLFLNDTYVRSYRVALGADGKTPTGKWKVVNRQTNPGWVDPHTGKRYHPDDPKNPIGEYWIGLEGVEGAAVGAFGYGIHGTNEPETIGRDVSLGCVRLAPDDIGAVYKLLLPGASLVTITD